MGKDDDEQFRNAWADACADAPAPAIAAALANKRNYSADALAAREERSCAICMVATRDAFLQVCCSILSLFNSIRSNSIQFDPIRSNSIQFDSI